MINAWNNYHCLHDGWFLSAVGVHAVLELEDEEDKGGFVNPVGGGGWFDELINVCGGMFDGNFVSTEIFVIQWIVLTLFNIDNYECLAYLSFK